MANVAATGLPPHSESTKVDLPTPDEPRKVTAWPGRNQGARQLFCCLITPSECVLAKTVSLVNNVIDSQSPDGSKTT